MLRRTLALLLGLAVGLGLAELALRAADLPRFHRAHSTTAQFDFLKSRSDGRTFFVNKRNDPIPFVYDSDPRGYFGPENRITHPTNVNGFRGPECALTKPAGVFRVVFLGDSFTFGEGVRFEDTFASLTVDRLAERLPDARMVFESCNLGVSGYNTADALFLFNALVPRLQPDAVVLGYVINDAEPPLFETAPDQEPVRRAREAEIAEGVASPTPPDLALYRLRVAQLVWQFVAERSRGAQTEDYYRALYRADAPGWIASGAALDALAAACRRASIPLLVVSFPVLHQLDGSHPFEDLYRTVQERVEAAGGAFLDLFPVFSGRDAESLWVHPTDQHPNEVAHRMAAEAIAERLAAQIQGGAASKR